MSNERNAKHIEYMMQTATTYSHRKALEAGATALREVDRVRDDLAAAHKAIMPHCCPGPDEWPESAQWWDVAGDRLVRLTAVLRAGKEDRWAATHGSDEAGFRPADWVVEAEAILRQKAGTDEI